METTAAWDLRIKELPVESKSLPCRFSGKGFNSQRVGATSATAVAFVDLQSLKFLNLPLGPDTKRKRCIEILRNSQVMQ